MNKEFCSTIKEDYKWLRVGMDVWICRENGGIYVNGESYGRIEQFEKTYGQIVSGEQLAEDFLWHVKGLHAWHDVIKAKILQEKNQGAIGMFVSQLMVGHNIPQKYVVAQLHWWGFDVRRNVINIRSSDANLNPLPPRRNLKLV